MSSELEQTQLELARLQLERERRRMRAEEAVGSAARGAAVGTARLVGGVLRVAGQIVLGAVIGFAVACGLVTLLAMVAIPTRSGDGVQGGFSTGCPPQQDCNRSTLRGSALPGNAVALLTPRPVEYCHPHRSR